MTIRKKIIVPVLFLLLALVFGSFQEKLKISVNNLLKYSSFIEGYNNLSVTEREEKVSDIVTITPRDFYSHQMVVSWLYALDKNELEMLKWVNTVVFILVHFLFNAFILFFLFSEKGVIKILGVTYLFLFVFAAGVFFVGKITGNDQAGYNVARKIVGALQSQVPLMVFVAGYYLNKKSMA